MIVNQNIICIDCETGGFSPEQNPLTQVAFVAFDSFTFKEKARYMSYIKPYDDSLYMSEQAIQITGITLDKCKQEGKELSVVLKEMDEIFKSLKVSYYKPYLLGHNLDFDLTFLTNAYDRVYGPNSGPKGVNALFKYVLSTPEDTMLLARKRFQNHEVADFKLGTLCKHIGYINKNAHDALADVLATKELYRYFVTHLAGSGGDFQVEKQEEFKYQF